MEEHSFGYWLRLRRKSLDLTLEGLADRVGCSVALIRKLESEERRPSAQIVGRLAEIFEIQSDEHKDFARFARGDWSAAPGDSVESTPWRVTRESEKAETKISLVTFLFTDIESSAKLWDASAEKMQPALQRHHEILQEAISSNNGKTPFKSWVTRSSRPFPL
jgi:transcriptional regulator with XRE-family HTH domain